MSQDIPDRDDEVGAVLSQIAIGRISPGRTPDLSFLRQEGAAEGYAFVERAAAEWMSAANRFDESGEVFYVARRGDTTVGMCGLNIDPYIDDRTVGRLRHLYVAPEFRCSGVGHQLVVSCLDRALGRFDRVRLRSLEPGASRFYETMGFHRVDELDATHSFDLF